MKDKDWGLSLILDDPSGPCCDLNDYGHDGPCVYLCDECAGEGCEFCDDGMLTDG